MPNNSNFAPRGQATVPAALTGVCLRGERKSETLTWHSQNQITTENTRNTKTERSVLKLTTSSVENWSPLAGNLGRTKRISPAKRDERSPKSEMPRVSGSSCVLSGVKTLSLVFLPVIIALAGGAAEPGP